MSLAELGIVGGSGLYDMEGVTDLQEVYIDTPYGAPSDALMVGKVDGTTVAFLPRHGRDHRVAPHEINYRANIWALKTAGVKWLLSSSAVGSLREDIRPGDFVIIDQFIDRTRARPSTFFEGGVVAHVTFSDPVCPIARGVLIDACREVGTTAHDGGTYVCIEGPQFSTRAESNLYRSFGASVVGMTNLTEARLAREAEIAYATLAMATDYDCWHEAEEEVSVEAVLAVIKDNIHNAKQVLRAAIPRLSSASPSPAWEALRYAVLSKPAGIDPEKRAQLSLLLGEPPTANEEE